MKSKIIVTGGLGFIGSNLIKLLVQKGYYVINIDKYSYSSNFYNLIDIKKNYKYYKININNQKIIKKILFKYRPICIFNLAAETHVDKSIDSPLEFINSNILGTYNILEAIRYYQKQTKQNKFKFIHISTDEVYGDISKKKFSLEYDSYQPSSPYSASKGSSDLLVKSYIKTFNVPAIITNCCNNYGTNQYPEKLIPRLILNIKENINLPIYGNGKNEREWIHVEDHCNALYEIFKKGRIGENYNIGSGTILNNLNLAQIILKISKKYIKSKSKIIFVKDRPGHDKRYALNSKKIRKELSWKPTFEFKEGIEKTIKWYLNNNKWLNKLKNKNYKMRIGLNK